MAKNLSQSRIDRQNILNNDIAIREIEEASDIDAVFFEGKLFFTGEMLASFFEVETHTIERCISANYEELKKNGYEVLRGGKLKEFLKCHVEHFGTESYDDIKTTALGIFDFRAFLNIAMLLSESEQARALRQLILDIAIDIINCKTGGGTKYINQRNKDFVHVSTEDSYRRKLTDTLKNCVVSDNFKYAHFTDMIYVSIFGEKAKEYKKILDLKATEKVRDTFYGEILDIINAYESGLTDEIKNKFNELGRPLSIKETEDIFRTSEGMTVWSPLIQKARAEMASRDAALREEFRYKLPEYIQHLDTDEYQKFLGAAGDELERLMQENHEVLRRLKERG